MESGTGTLLKAGYLNPPVFRVYIPHSSQLNVTESLVLSDAGPVCLSILQNIYHYVDFLYVPRNSVSSLMPLLSPIPSHSALCHCIDVLWPFTSRYLLLSNPFMSMSPLHFLVLPFFSLSLKYLCHVFTLYSLFSPSLHPSLPPPLLFDAVSAVFWGSFVPPFVPVELIHFPRRFSLETGPDAATFLRF